MQSLKHDAKRQEETAPYQPFLESFEQVCQIFQAIYFSQDDPPAPASFIYSPELTKSLLALMPEQFCSMVNQLRGYSDEGREFRIEFNTKIYELRDAIQEWFELAGFDYENIPPPSSKAQKAKLTGGFREHKTAYQFGQIIYVGSSSKTRGWAELYRASDGWCICSFYPRTSGICWSQETTETVWQIATALANLTNWDAYDQQSVKVKRAIGKRVIQITEPLSSYLSRN